jgi:hypothetical protein
MIEDLSALGTLKGLAGCALSLRDLVARPTKNLSAYTGYLLDHTNVLAIHNGSEASTREEAHQIHSVLSWLDAGLPAFDLTHGLMAALLLTDPADVNGEDVRLPFSTFIVRLPDGFWTMEDHTGVTTGAGMALVHTYTAITTESPDDPVPMLSFRIMGRNGKTSTWESRLPIPETGPVRQWLGDDVSDVIDYSGTVGPPDEQDHNHAVAFRRLLINLCLYVAERGRGERAGKRKPGKGPERPRPLGDPDLWVLGREVKLDRDLMDSAKAWSDSLQGKRAAWSLRAKFTVRGHWRNQAHGVGRALRRLKWIAPFWKGEGPTFAHVYMEAK